MTKERAPAPPVPKDLRLLVQALGGDRQALERAAGLETRTVRDHRLEPALYLRALELGPGFAAPAGWRSSFQQTVARQLLFERHLQRIGKLLAAAGIPWLPIKGLDLCSRIYRQPEERPAGDIDILVQPQHLQAARRALEEEGWCAAFHGDRYEAFLRDEGYCWLTAQPDGTQLEVHFRLWGMAPEAYGESLFARATADPSLGATGHRPSLEDAYLLAAVHVWMSSPPRPLLQWLDLHLLARAASESFPGKVLDLARQWHLDLPVALAAAQTRALWPSEVQNHIAQGLSSELRPLERRLFQRAEREGADGISLGALTLTRLLSRRRSRSGWRAVSRRIWAHPGIVERESPTTSTWPLRRLGHLWRRVRDKRS